MDNITDIQELILEATNGDCYAQCDLGQLYRLGQHVEQNYNIAAEWFEKSANNGVARAQQELGALYHHGNGVKQCDATAKIWYEKSAEQGDSAAQSCLGMLYLLGEGIDKDLVKAKSFLIKAAEQDYSRAQFNLGVIARDDENNLEEALQWFEKAANNGHVDAEYTLALYFLNDEKFFNLDNGLFWLQKAATDDSIEAQSTLGFAFLNADYGLEEDPEKALYWITMAAEQGDEEATEFLASLLMPNNHQRAKPG